MKLHKCEELKNMYVPKESLGRLEVYDPPSIKSKPIFESEEEAYSLDTILARYIWPKLVWYRDKVSFVEEWKEILNKMCYAFERAQESWNIQEEEWEKVKEGIQLFSEWYFAIWW